MNKPINVLLQTTIEPTVNDWRIGRFSILGRVWQAGTDSLLPWRFCASRRVETMTEPHRHGLRSRTIDVDQVLAQTRVRGLPLASGRCTVAILILILFALAASTLAEAFPPQASDLNHVRHFAPRTVFPVNESEWRDATPGMPPGSRHAVITGDPTRAEHFVLRVELPQGYRVAPYSRSADENLMVLSGTLMIGHGRSLDRTRMRALPSGSFQLLRANEAHYMMTSDGATVQIFGVGPFALEYVTSP